MIYNYKLLTFVDFNIIFTILRFIKIYLWHIFQKLQSEAFSMDSELCETLIMSSVSLGESDSSAAVREDDSYGGPITLKGCCRQLNYQLLITPASNYLCDRCRRYTAISETRVCDHCSRVLTIK